jgi:hypothetical protein
MYNEQLWVTFLKLPLPSVDATSPPLQETGNDSLSCCLVAAVSYLLPTGVPGLVRPVRCGLTSTAVCVWPWSSGSRLPLCAPPVTSVSRTSLLPVSTSEVRTLVTVLGLKTVAVQRSHSLHHLRGLITTLSAAFTATTTTQYTYKDPWYQWTGICCQTQLVGLCILFYVPFLYLQQFL